MTTFLPSPDPAQGPGWRGEGELWVLWAPRVPRPCWPRCSTVASRPGVGGGEAGVPNDSASVILQSGEVLAQALRPQCRWERGATGQKGKDPPVLAAAGLVTHTQSSPCLPLGRQGQSVWELPLPDPHICCLFPEAPEGLQSSSHRANKDAHVSAWTCHLQVGYKPQAAHDSCLEP